MNTPFEIAAVEIIDNGGALKATFDVVLRGFTLHRCRLMVPQEKPPFIAGPSSKDSYAPRGWRVHATIDRDVAAEICAAVRERLAIAEAA